jgi:hypothetical protein
MFHIYGTSSTSSTFVASFLFPPGQQSALHRHSVLNSDITDISGIKDDIPYIFNRYTLSLTDGPFRAGILERQRAGISTCFTTKLEQTNNAFYFLNTTFTSPDRLVQETHSKTHTKRLWVIFWILMSCSYVNTNTEALCHNTPIYYNRHLIAIFS